MEIINKEPNNGMHPAVPELQEFLRQGKLSRREFLRMACLLGVSAGAASVMAACAQPAAPTTQAPAATQAPVATQAPAATVAPVATAAPVVTEAPTPAAAAGVVRGGKLVCASSVKKVTHPAQFSWVTPSNQLRQVAEYLTQTDGNNITHPLLLESFKPSDDLKTWTLNLPRGSSSTMAMSLPPTMWSSPWASGSRKTLAPPSRA